MKHRLRFVMVLSALLLAAGGILVMLGMTVNNGRIYPNVTVGNIPVGNLTRSQALAALTDAGWQKRAEKVLTVHSYEGVSVCIDPVQAGIMLPAEEAADAAYAYGRSSGIAAGLIRYLKSGKESVDINALQTQWNAGYIDACIASLTSQVDACFSENAWTIDESGRELVLLKAQGTLHLDTSALPDQIFTALVRGDSDLEAMTLAGEAVCPDFVSIYDAVCAEMQDACYAADGSHTLIPERVGYRFDVREAKMRWEAAPLIRQVRIPLEITYPALTKEKIESLQFHDLLGAVTTKYNNSGENRRSNVRLAAEKINGTILYPGEEFSFNEVVGRRTPEAGFLPAPAYAGYDDIKEEIGGGVCQVSTGVYAAALFSFLEIRSHTCHIYPPNYIQLGMDATVSIPEGGGRTLDLKIVNNKKTPVRIDAYCEETERNGRPYRTVTVEIWGMLEEGDYMPVEFDNSYGNIYDYDRVIDPAYPDREGVKIKFTHEENEFEDDTGKGLRTLTHRKIFDSRGNLLEDRIINPTYSAGYAMDTYYYMFQ
ncbi:MAG: VanW family protein [Oscillospiraceae bacterium]|nr:VanW family protein [Oscillospiraceae bacterium]